VDREFIAAVLDRAGESGATVAVMHYVDGMSQVEIAEVLGSQGERSSTDCAGSRESLGTC